MKVRLPSVCAFSLTLLLATMGASAAEPAVPSPHYSSGVVGAEPGVPRDDRLVVKLKADAASRAPGLPEYGLPQLPELAEMCARHGIADGYRVVRQHGTPIGDWAVFSEIGLDRLYVLQLGRQDSKKVSELVDEFSRQPWVEYAEPVYLLRHLSAPNDAEFSNQWSHVNVGQNVNGSVGSADADADTDLAWDTQVGGPTHIVAVLDSGVDLDHPDLVANLVPGWDFIDEDPNPDDFNGHGTGSCGIAAARGNNSIGVAGVCHQCGLMPLRVSDSVDEADAMRFAADNGAHTYNMSHTFGAVWLQGVIDATEYATALGALGFASAINSTGYSLGTPAAYEEVVPVGGSNSSDVRVYAYNDVTELTAPGPNTRSTALNGGYTYFGGTSSSSPFAAGLATLLRAEDPNLHVHELRYLMRLSSDDEVGAPSEDTAGWDQFMGYGRVNANKAMQMIDGPWMGLNRPHYVCTGDLTVALKDELAAGSPGVTLTASGGDSETVIVNPVTADGYHEGALNISWVGNDGPLVIGDGKLDVVHGETITATILSGDGTPLSATAFMDCDKRMCRLAEVRPTISGDCDADGAADPGEIWTLQVPVLNYQTEPFDALATLESADPNVEILSGPGPVQVIPFNVAVLSFQIRVKAGAPTSHSIDFDLNISGPGWVADDVSCQSLGWENTMTIIANRDLGPALQTWDFDDGTPQGFGHGVAHGTGDLPECSGTYFDDWETSPTTDRSHSGSHSMRLGTGTTYSGSLDAGLFTTPFVPPVGGGALGFRLWMDAEMVGSSIGTFAADGLVIETKGVAEPDWSVATDVTYNADQDQNGCQGFPIFDAVDMIGGDGAGGSVDGDTFDREHLVNITGVPGPKMQVRFRFGSDGSVQGEGAWIDTVTVYGPYTADNWPGGAPSNLVDSNASCPTSLDLTWDGVAGSGAYNVYRSETSCADASSRPDVYGTSGTPTFTDATVVENVDYYYAVEATESGSACPTERACIAASCVCALGGDPANLLAARVANDVALTWNDPGGGGLTWNVYRETVADTTLWGAPFAGGIVDVDGGTPGIQYVDVGGVSADPLLFYLATSVNACGESPLR
ncbi:MAG: S8 family serine peptidase [Acidobacteriota bacterium]|nr:S8 family serine peptidase [Acidobacteriota bacterium]MDH3785220.1 S8 family serine peptidase [Acidobacteriota bacterium]